MGLCFMSGEIIFKIPFDLIRLKTSETYITAGLLHKNWQLHVHHYITAVTQELPHAHYNGLRTAQYTATIACGLFILQSLYTPDEYYMYVGNDFHHCFYVAESQMKIIWALHSYIQYTIMLLSTHSK